ncbi:hypothetical protein TUM20983_27790 [Mycobacterium antarcticum]|nr:hypothetical protein TUM20983_27790 [Mycolicibacterium sp. TUM20983]GLP83980.1 hypothetical protein TUM20984_54000 [Mycolicibacterium sp. TUM20984]
MPKNPIVAQQLREKAGSWHRIQGMANSGENPEYRITRARDTDTYVQASNDGGIRITHGKTHIVLDPDETATLIRVARRLTKPNRTAAQHD